MNINENVRNKRENMKQNKQVNEERNHFKTHASWLLIAQKGCFLESNNCYDCHWKQNIARKMFYTHVISYIKYEIFLYLYE